MELHSYDKYLIQFSGGKDSLACLLWLLDQGVDKSKIELWHQDVDGREGSKMMDWPVTRDYCRKVASHFGIPIYFQWKVGGFEREMLRDAALTAPTAFQIPGGEVVQVGGTRGKPGTRLKFPAQSADLSVRWCSAYLKIDVGATAIRNQVRFDNSRTLVITGERAEESSARANYLEFETHRADNRNGRKARHVDQLRPIHKWTEAQVWGIIQQHGIVPHPAYRIGYGRVSCMNCIFGNPDQWATSHQVNPEGVTTIINYEDRFGHTIRKGRSVRQQVAMGTPYAAAGNTALAVLAMSDYYNEPIYISPDQWELPAGAFGDNCGPS